MHVTLVLPAYNAVRTLSIVYEQIRAEQIVQRIILVDDASGDGTAEVARSLPGLEVVVHPQNRGYGGNQKTCYEWALRESTDWIIMLHPDGQHPPHLLSKMIQVIQEGRCDCVFASRFLSQNPREQGMPFLKYYVNRALTRLQNIIFQQNLTEYHTGYRAFSRATLQKISFEDFSDSFLFDNQLLCEILHRGYRVSEIACPTIYSAEASSINFIRSFQYMLGCLFVSIKYFFKKTFH